VGRTKVQVQGYGHIEDNGRRAACIEVGV